MTLGQRESESFDVRTEKAETDRDRETETEL